MNEIFLDTETTGLSFKDGHKIVEIACIETKDLIATGRIFHKLINPKRDVPEDAFKVHGFSEEYLSDKNSFDQIADEFLNFVKDKKIIIHNAPFDLAFINGELKSIKKNVIDNKFVIDSLDLARNKFPGVSNSLDALCKRFRIDNSKRDKHTALIDCELLYKVYINLFNQKEPSLDFNEVTEKTSNFNNLKNIDYFKGIVIPSAEELELHKNFIKKSLKKKNF